MCVCVRAGAVYRVAAASSSSVQANRENCAKLAGLLQEVLRLVDAAARRQGHVPASPEALAALVGLAERASQLVGTYTKSGACAANVHKSPDRSMYNIEARDACVLAW